MVIAFCLSFSIPKCIGFVHIQIIVQLNVLSFRPLFMIAVVNRLAVFEPVSPSDIFISSCISRR